MIQKSCNQCPQPFEITDDDLKFYEKVKVPTPVICSDCRQQRRMAFRNECTLYRRSCDLCSKNIVSIHASKKPFPVYCSDCFWSDKWNPLDYGIDIDLNKSFFAQWQELSEKVPRLGIINKQSENSDYCNYSFANKNCYLTFGSHYEEDCLYGQYSTKNRNCVDSWWIYGSDYCYEVYFSKTCHRSVYLDHCEDCSDSYFSVDLKGCKNCIFSSNLRHKEYYILNESYSKEEYFKKLESYNLQNHSRFQEAKQFYVHGFRKQFPFRSVYQTNCQNCEGNNLENCKNVTTCFDCTGCEDCRYGFQMDETYSSMDMNFMGYDKSELCYETIGCTGTYNCMFCDSCWHDSFLFYCHLCFSSKHSFGCISLQQKEYCVLNKQYSKEEYESIRIKLIEQMKSRGEWGGFFPMSLAPFAYNETVGQEYFPLEKDQVLAWNGKWQEKDVKNYQPQSYTIPDDIKDVQSSICESILACEACEKNYKIVPMELAFYKEMGLSIPHSCPNCRRAQRMRLFSARTLWDRQCVKCQRSIKTTYASDRIEKVYCEECYLGEVY